MIEAAIATLVVMGCGIAAGIFAFLQGAGGENSFVLGGIVSFIAWLVFQSFHRDAAIAQLFKKLIDKLEDKELVDELKKALDET